MQKKLEKFGKKPKFPGRKKAGKQKKK